MAYTIVETKHQAYPDESALSAALSAINLSIQDLLDPFKCYACPLPIAVGQGYQMAVADHLETYLEGALRRDGLRPSRSRYDLTYSPHLNQHADLGLVHTSSKRRVLFEIEFRPNYEKDLVKFQIGANSGLLAAGVMVLSLDRKSLNPGYTSMPEYASAIRVLDQLRPTYPLLVIGIRGQHAV